MSVVLSGIVTVKTVNNGVCAVRVPAAFLCLLKGAGTSGTYAENRRALDRWKLVPRVLNDVGERNLEVYIPKVSVR